MGAASWMPARGSRAWSIPGLSARSARSPARAIYGPDGELLDPPLQLPLRQGANIEGRPVVATADDFTMRGGAADAAIARKMVQAEMMAHQLKLPIIRMIDGTGGGGIGQDARTDRRDLYPRGARLGRCGEEPRHRAGGRAGAGADGGPWRGADGGQPLFDHGQGPQPDLRRRPRRGRWAGRYKGGAANHEEAKEALGGSAIHTRNGVVDDEVASEAEAFARARHFLSFMPEYVGQHAPRCAMPTRWTARKRRCSASSRARRKQVYSMRRCARHGVRQRHRVRDRPALGPRRDHRALARLDGWPVA
jgi:hypothetical protein